MSCPARRPAIFLALGRSDPPFSLEVDGKTYIHEKTIKHDSWAATGVYRSDAMGRVVCKFNRVQPIGIIPAAWIGRWLTRRESWFYQQLSDVPGVPKVFGSAQVDGRPAHNVVVHEFVEGHPLRWHDRVDDNFFPDLRALLETLHERNIAYLDMNKWENIIIDRAGRPNLIDFQISLRLPRVWPVSLLLRMLQQSDLYHLQKHLVRVRPDLVGMEAEKTLEAARPWWIRLHRMFARPFRFLRRSLLTLLGVRDRKGKPQSEPFVEEGLREIETTNAPISRLYHLLVSDDYFAMSGNESKKYVARLFVDLFGRQPERPEDRRLVRRIVARQRHDIVLALLKSSEVSVTSSRLSEKWLERKARQIRRAIRRYHQSDEQAA